MYWLAIYTYWKSYYYRLKSNNFAFFPLDVWELYIFSIIKFQLRPCSIIAMKGEVKKPKKGECRVNKNVWPPHVCVSYHLVKIFMRQEKHHGDETYKQERLTFLCRKHVKMLKRPTHKKAPCFYYSFTL